MTLIILEINATVNLIASKQFVFSFIYCYPQDFKFYFYLTIISLLWLVDKLLIFIKIHYEFLLYFFFLQEISDFELIGIIIDYSYAIV